MGKAFKVDTSWAVELDDHEWYGVDSEAQAKLIADAKEQAKLEGCTGLTIFAVPDPIFPLYGHTTKRRVHSETLAHANTKAYEIRTTYRAEIPKDTWESTPENLRTKLLRKVRDALNSRGETSPGRYEILVCAGDQCQVVERGRV